MIRTGGFLSRGWFVAALIVLIASAACSLLIDSNATQCQSDGDCAKYPGTRCVSGGCVAGSAGDAGADANCWDPNGFGGRGCFSCTPSTSEELLNACAPYA